MKGLLKVLKIKPGEGRMAALVIGLMLCISAGSSIGGNATEALFFARFGVELLPGMYVILGLTTFLTSMVITVMMGRLPKQRLFSLLPFAIGFILVGERLVILLNLTWFFAVMWLGMNVIGSLQGLLTWGLAGAACDTRQAKRLFPLFSAGGILGTVLGGLATRPLAGWLHSENLLLIWAGTSFTAFVLGRALGRYTAQARTPARTRAAVGVVEEMQRGYKFVRQSAMMRWVSYSAVIFSVCYFSLALPFSRGVTAQFPDADQLAGFLGVFQSLNTAVALLASLLLANRLFARFGIMPMLLLFPIIYLIDFGLLAITAPFLLLVAARFAQLAWMEGIANPAWQALFNVVPPGQRDQVRAFIGGVPEQAGTLIAGLVLLIGEQALQPQQMYFIGLAAAALQVYVTWRASKAYGGALLEALRAGQPHMFFSDDQPFGGFRTDSAALVTVVRSLSAADAQLRRVSAEILGNISIPEAATYLIWALQDEDGDVRAAALRGLARARAAPALLEIAACLNDPQAEVRYQAVEAIEQLAPYPRGLGVYIEPLLADENPMVRARAALALVRQSGQAAARQILREMAANAEAEVRVQALSALAECKDPSAFELAVYALADPRALVRQGASAALVVIHPERAVQYLIPRLSDDEPSGRSAFVQAIGRVGPPALEALLEALSTPGYEEGALQALEQIPGEKPTAPLRARAQAEAQAALRYHDLSHSLKQKYIPPDEESRWRCQLLVDSLHEKALGSGVNTLRILGLLNHHEMVAAAVEHLRSRAAAQRANALETLEALRERELITPLLALWEGGEQAPTPLPESWLSELLHDPHPWLRACAVLVAARSDLPQICDELRALSAADPDPFVRDEAEKALTGENRMDTLATLSLMERILFLRRVPMFADLPPADIKQVAALMGEVVFGDGEMLAQQGELGDEMYIIVSGEVRVLITPENQDEAHEVARRCCGDFVGEMTLISREPRFATLIADGTVRSLYLDQEQFESLVRERPEISLAVMRVLCRRLKEASGGRLAA